MRRLRIALCITELEVGGAEKAFVELATAVDPQRFQPVAYCLGPPPSGQQAVLIDRLLGHPVPVHYLGSRRPWQALSALRRLRRMLAEQRPDLFQSFLFHANLVGRLAARRAGVPRVLSGIRVAEPRRWYRWADRITQRLVDRYVCVSQDVAHFCRTGAGLPPEKLTVIPNGIDVSRFDQAKPADLEPYGVPPGRRAVTYIGRIDHQKGIDWLLTAAPLWLNQLFDCDLLVVGRGDKLGEMKDLAKKVGISRRVHFAGWRAEVPQIVAASSLVVLPSRWEGMPNVVLEAMAGARAVVAAEVEGVRQLLGPGADDQVVRYGDSPAWAQRVVHLLSHPELAARIGLENRRRAARHFSLQAMVDRYEQLWESLAGPHARRAPGHA